jgi:uncharacterized protein (UPF0335 family)
MKQPNDDGLAEMLEATRAELRRAVAKIAKLEVEKADLANMVLIYAYRAEQAAAASLRSIRCSTKK